MTERLALEVPDSSLEVASASLKVSRPGEFHFQALAGRVEDWRAGLGEAIARMDKEAAGSGQSPFRSLIELLSTIPGVSALGATTILAEIGRDVSRLSNSWASHCPGWFVSRPERKCGQTQILTAAQRRALAEIDACAMRLGRQPQKRQLLQGAVRSAQKPARP
jgi:transposase